MADISNLKVGSSVYSIKDSTARTTANNANTKIDNSKIIGTYTENTQTLEVSLEIGTVS